MPERTVKTAAELESIIIAELREHPECESAAVVIGPTGAGWDATLAGTEATIDVVQREARCKAPLRLEVVVEPACAAT